MRLGMQAWSRMGKKGDLNYLDRSYMVVGARWGSLSIQKLLIY